MSFPSHFNYFIDYLSVNKTNIEYNEATKIITFNKKEFMNLWNKISTFKINWLILDNNFKLYGFQRINGGKDRICIYKVPDSFEIKKYFNSNKDDLNENKDDLETVILDDDEIDSLCDFNHEDGLLSINLKI
jgi:hypothetical protein